MVCLFLRHILCSYYRLLLLCTWPKIIPRYHTYLDHVAACSSSHYLSKMTYFFSFFHNLTSHLYLRYAYNIKEIEKIRNCISLQKTSTRRDKSTGLLRSAASSLAFRATLEHGGELGCSLDISKERRARWKSPLDHLASSRRVTFEYLARFSLDSRSRRS